MIAQKTFQQGFGHLKTYCTSLLASDRFVVELVKNQETRKVFETSLNIFCFICEQLNKLTEANDLIAKYTKLTKNQFVPETKLTFQDDYDLLDQIKYLAVYFKNTYDCSIEQIDQFDGVNREKKVVLQPVNDHSQQQTTKSQEKAQNAFFNTFNSQPHQEGTSFDPRFTKEAFAEQTSRVKLQEDIIFGRFYCYLTKPKEILFIKYLLLAIYVVLTGLFVVLLAMILIQTSLVNLDSNKWVEYFQNSFDNASKIKDRLNTGLGGIFLHNHFALVFIFLFGVIFNCFLIKKNYRLLYNHKNDNQRYFLEAKGFIWLVTFLILSLISLNNAFLFTPFDIITMTKTYVAQSGVSYYSFYYAMFIIGSISLVFLGLVICLFIIGFWFNPKKDMFKIKSKLEEYYQQFLRSEF